MRAARIGKMPILLLGLACVIAGCASRPPAKLETGGAEAAVSTGKAIQRITVAEDDATATVVVHGSQPLTYTAVKHQSPDAVVLYFPETVSDGVDAVDTSLSSVIAKIQVSELKKEKTRATRIEIALNADAPYEVTREGNQVVVQLMRNPGTSAAQKASEKAASEKAAETGPSAKPKQGSAEGQVEAPAAPLQNPADPAAKSPSPATKSSKAPDQLSKDQDQKEPAWVNRIDFQAMGGGRSQIVIGTTKPVRHETEKTSGRRLLLRLLGAQIPEFQSRPLITTRFESAVDRIIPVKTPQGSVIAVIGIELREDVPFKIEQQGNLTLVNLEASTVPPRPMAEAERPAWVQAMQGTSEAPVKPAPAAPKAPSMATGTMAGHYTGKRISLDFQDADIHNIFRILHEISGKNFVIGDDVKGRVTLKLDNVPWDQVLELILRMNKLGQVVEGNVVRIATLATLEAEQKALEARVKAQQEALKELEEAEPLVTAYIPVNYGDALKIKPHLEEIKTGRGKISTDERTNMIIMKDTQGAIDNAAQVVKSLDVVTPQVLIEARIVEATKSFSRELGVQWGGSYSASGHDGNATTTGTVAGLLGGQNFAVNLPVTAATGGLGFTFGRVGGTILSLDARLQSMESRGQGKIVSAPRVVTLDNSVAKIKQGVEYPFNKLDESGNTVTEYKDVDLLLEVTPHVTPDNRVDIKIKATKNDLGDVISGQQSFTTKETETELLVNDGDTLVIGGITKTTERTATDGIPGLSRLPVLGWLFKNKSDTDEREELLIFITPTIVRLEPARAGS